MAATDHDCKVPPVEQWLEGIAGHGGPDEEGLHTAQCEPQWPAKLKNILSGGCGIGTSMQACSIIAQACMD